MNGYDNLVDGIGYMRTTPIGQSSLPALTTGSYNTAIGYNALIGFVLRDSQTFIIAKVRKMDTFNNRRIITSVNHYLVIDKKTGDIYQISDIAAKYSYFAQKPFSCQEEEKQVIAYHTANDHLWFELYKCWRSEYALRDIFAHMLDYYTAYI